MKKILVRILAVIGALVLVVVAMALIAGLVRGTKRVPSRAVLELNLETEMVEDVSDDPVARALTKSTPVVLDVVEALDRAGNDDHVRGLVAHFGDSKLGLGDVQEIRDAILRFRGKKKFAYAWAESYGGDWGPGSSPYYLASAFDQVFLQPSGEVQLTGVLMESPFVKGTLDKVGAKFHGDRRWEYKSAFNTLTETKYTAANREADAKVTDSVYGQIVRGIAETRHFSEAQVRAFVDQAPLPAKEAQEAKLIDGLKYRDEVYDLAKKNAGEGAEVIPAQAYLDRAGRPHQRGQTIALVYGVGPIYRGKSNFDPLSGNASMGSDTVAAALRSAADDKNVKAILFRMDSPGGSYVASDAIWEETVRARKAGKPVIASMGDVAGSGGYFVAMAADKIVAQPATITGSIGVLGGKMLTTGFWKMLGITFDQVHEGANATYWTSTEDYTPAEWARFQAWLDRVYADFTSKVADGRRLSKERVLQIAKGRIWSGEDAKALGLVDELGGFPEALALAKKAAAIPDGEDVKLKLYTGQKEHAWQLLFNGEDESRERRETASVLARTLPKLAAGGRQLRGLTGLNDGPLTMRPFVLH